ncbi:MAG: hypothetical protein HC877_22135 [Thioploca sp.]|nr:hypothetical protein [Thioploca sp.]
MNTQFIIKPDAYKRKDELIEFIRNKGYSILSVQDFEMTSHIFESIYKGLVPEPIIIGVYEYLSEDYCVRLKSDISISNLIELSGTNVDPLLCSEGTIRREFGAGRGLSKSGIEVIRNAIHRPKSIEQNEKQIKVLEEFL